MLNLRVQCHEAPGGSLVERVFSFLEKYPFSDATGEDVVLLSVASNPVDRG
jgi:hypothetical protein